MIVAPSLTAQNLGGVWEVAVPALEEVKAGEEGEVDAAVSPSVPDGERDEVSEILDDGLEQVEEDGVLPAAEELPGPEAPLPGDAAGWGVLPPNDPWMDDLDRELDLLAGEADAFADLEAESPGITAHDGVRMAEGFNADVLAGELLVGGGGAPLERQGIRLGIDLQGTYDSNLFLDPRNEVSDLSLTVSPSIEYRSAPAGVPGLVTLSYSPYFRTYLDETDLDTVDHSASGRVSFQGARGSYEVAADYGRFSHADRNVGGRRESESMGLRASGSYQVGARTTLDASLSARKSRDAGVGRPGVAGPGRTGQESLQFQLSGYWQATPKLRLGPSLRYSMSDSDGIGDRDALALLLVADFEARDGLSFDAALGVERVGGAADFSADDTTVTGSFGVRYQPGDRMALEAEVSYQAIPPGSHRLTRSGGGDQEITGTLSLEYTPNPDWAFGIDVRAESYPSVDSANYAIAERSCSVSVTRHLTRGAVTLAGTLGVSDYGAVGPVMAAREEEEFHALSLRYTRPMSVDGGQFHAALQWSENSGQLEWERLQVSVGLQYEY